MCVQADANVGASVPLVLDSPERDVQSESTHFPAMARSTSSAVCGSFAVRLISLPLLIHVESVFNPHSQFFLRDVDAGLKGKHRPRTQAERHSRWDREHSNRHSDSGHE